MRYSILVLFLSSLVAAPVFAAPPKTAPPKIVMKAKPGDVTFDHAAHAKREKEDCKVCHDKLWPQSATAPVGFKPVHKKFEDAKTSCGACHYTGGTAFATKGNCTNSKCHVRAAAKK